MGGHVQPPALEVKTDRRSHRLAKDLLSFARIKSLEDRLTISTGNCSRRRTFPPLLRLTSAIAATSGTRLRSRAWKTEARSLLLAPGSYSSSKGS